MINDKIIVVSLTSWPKRIKTVIKTIDTLLKQTLKPDYIELNLSLVEFPNKENDLPKKLATYAKKGKIEINWEESNTRAFKKIIPTLKKFYGQEYYLLTVDDDCLYREDYIQLMVDKLEEFQFQSFCLSEHMANTNRIIFHGETFEPDFCENLTEEVIGYSCVDAYVRRYFTCKGIYMPHYRPENVNEIIKDHDSIAPLNEEYRQEGMNEIRKAAVEKINFYIVY